MDTVTNVFQADDYKTKFKEEYEQLMVRNNNLALTIAQIQNGDLPYEPKTPIELLIDQLYAMDDYLHILEERAKIEGIDV